MPRTHLPQFSHKWLAKKKFPPWSVCVDPTLQVQRRGEGRREGGGKGGGSGWEGGKKVFWTHELQVWLARGSGATVATSMTQEMHWALHPEGCGSCGPPEDHT